MQAKRLRAKWEGSKNRKLARVVSCEGRNSKQGKVGEGGTLDHLHHQACAWQAGRGGRQRKVSGVAFLPRLAY
eukprot:133698-Pelagomonas_calceolata.AAC.2